MIHFIPAWYGNARPWYSTDEVWFRSTTQTQRDDTVTQLRVFREGAEEARLIVLNYAPNLRRFLHGQQLFDVPYWSLFDELQGLEGDYTRPLDVADLGWPEDVSFFYNPFLITVMRGFQVYARISLGRDGTLQSVRFYGDGMPSVERIFDDRGFLSSILMYDEQGQPMTQYYLSRAGDVLFSEDVASGQIDIVQNPGGRFREASYPGWAAIVAEFLGAHFAAAAVSGDVAGNRADTVVLALHPQHNEVVRAALDGQALVLSRATARPSECSAELAARASMLFTDVGQADEPGEGIQASLAPLPALAIYPLEHRPDFGASANEATVIISSLVDGMTLEELDQAIATMAVQLVADERTRLLVCTYRALDLDYLQGVREVISRYQRLDLQFAQGDDEALLGLDGVAGLEAEETIQLAFLDREPELLRTIAKTRVLVDLGERVNLALAAEAVNAGVPQINRVAHALAAHPLNGYLIESGAHLGEALDYFLSGLGHWNQSLVQCSVMKDLFSAREVLGRWELMREGVSHAHLADRG